MRQLLIPVLLLATAALSSSNVIPMLTVNKLETEQLDSDSQENDNIFSNRYQPKHILNDIFYTVSIATSPNVKQHKMQPLQLQYVDSDSNEIEDDSRILKKEDKYPGEGLRRKQWHNYPRQLDRLHRYLYEHHNSDKRNSEPDDPNLIDNFINENMQESLEDEKTNEFRTNKNDETINGYDTMVTNPFLIFKIRLACLGNELRNNDLSNPEVMLSEPEYVTGSKDEENMIENARNPLTSATKVKREEIGPQNAPISESTMTKNRAVKKRIFSLWSRLQSFNHKGHELQHRRHLHAFYGLPSDGDAGGLLTAETRATFMRPPGSPLRWG